MVVVWGYSDRENLFGKKFEAHQGEGQQDEEQADAASRDAQDLLHPLGNLHLAALRFPLSVRHASWRVQVPRIVHVPAA